MLFSPIFLLRLSGVQTFVAKTVVSYLNSSYSINIQLERVYIKNLHSLELGGIYILDHHQDTMLAAATIDFELNKYDLTTGLFKLKELNIKGVDFRLITYKGDSTSNISHFLNAFGESEPGGSSPDILCERLSLDGANFTINNQNETQQDFQIDYEHLNVTEIALELEELNFSHSKLLANINALSFDNPYIHLTNLQSKVAVSADSLILKELKLLTHNSILNGEFVMDYSKGFENFVLDVPMFLRADRSIIASQDIAAFSEELFGLDERIFLNGEVTGVVDSLYFNELSIQSEFYLFLNGKLFSVTEPEDMAFESLSIVLDGDLSRIPSYPFQKDSILILPSIVFDLGDPELSIDLNGNFKKLDLIASLKSREAVLQSEAKLFDVFEEYFRIEAQTRVDHLALNKLAGIKYLSDISMDMDLQWEGRDIETAVVISNMEIDRLVYRRHTYDSLYLQSILDRSSLSNTAYVFDKHLKVFAQANSIISNGDLESSGRLIVKGFQPYPLHLSPDFDSLTTNFTIAYAVSSKGSELESLQLNFDTLFISNKRYKYADGNMQLSVLSSAEDSVVFKSKAVSLEAYGDILDLDLAALVHELKENIGLEKMHTEGKRNKLLINGNFGDSKQLSSIFAPGLKLSKGSTFHYDINSESRETELTFSSAEFAYNNVLFQNLELSFNAKENQLQLLTQSSSIKIGDSLSIAEMILTLDGTSDSSVMVLSVDKERDSDLSVYLETKLAFDASKLYADFEEGRLHIMDSLWEINSVSEIRLDTSGIYIPLINAISGKKFVNISGVIGKTNDEVLNLNFNKLNLSNVDDIFGLNTLKLKGKLSGSVQMSAALADLQLGADLSFKGLHVNDQLIGSGEFAASWDKDENALVMKGNFHENNKPVIWFNGAYLPSQVEEQLNFSLLVRDLRLKSLEPFLASYISDIEGKISGDLKLSGSVNEPKLYSNMTFNKAVVKVNYLGTKYFIDKQTAKVRHDWFGFDYIQIQDELGNTAQATATIFHENYKNLNYDINLVTEGFQFLNTSFKDNNLFYGKAVMGGDLNLSGQDSKLLIEANVETQSDSRIYIPLEGAEEVTESSYIVFVQPDSLKKQESYKANLEGIEMNLNIDVSPEAEIQLIFDEVAGDIMKARGEGALQLKINPAGEFNMYGNYRLTEGSYLFTLKSLINKKFELIDGSSILWNGDPLHAKLDIKAKYNLRARLSDLLQDETLNKRVNTQVNLFMKEDLMSPDISFGVEFPGLDESVQSRANLALNNEEQLNRQVFSLLLLSSFSPPEGGLQAGGSAGATSTELLANQLSNWMSHLSDKMQLSVSELNAESFELGLSRGFFDDRVTVEGNVGVTSNGDQSTEEQNASRLVGDVKVEYKITKDGKFRAKVFNESNDNAIVNQQNAKDTQGVGIFYRENFDTWGEFWRKVFRRNKKGSE